jgi:hypothetical protein
MRRTLALSAGPLSVVLFLVRQGSVLSSGHAFAVSLPKVVNSKS